MTILKRTLILIMCVILSLTMAFLLTSCEEEESPSESQHEHSYGEFMIAKEPTCTESGEKIKACSCGDKVIEKIEARGHIEEAIARVEPTCTETGLTEGKKCSVCGEILVAQEIIDATGEHKFEGSYNCTVCNVKVYNESQGLKYTLSNDETYYIVTRIGNCTDTRVVIPYTYEGLPVKEIGERAFYDCDSLKSVIIPDSVTTIGDDAFSSCYSLKSVIIGNSVESIGGSAFYWCDSLKSVIIPDSVTSIGKRAFEGCFSLFIYCEAESQPRGWGVGIGTTRIALYIGTAKASQAQTATIGTMAQVAK